MRSSTACRSSLSNDSVLGLAICPLMTVWIQNPFDGLPFEGGRKQRYWLMSEAFIRAGHRVVYWTSDFSHATKGRRPSVPSGAVPNGMEIRFVPTRPYRSNVCLARQMSHRAYAAEWARMASGSKEPPSLVVTSMPTISAASAALALGRRFGARVVVDVQDAWPETFERLFPRWTRWAAHPLLAPWRRRAQRIYRDADAVTGVCDRYRALTGRADYYRAYLGIEGRSALPVSEPSRDGTVRLVYSGNLGRSYDLATVVEAVRADESLSLDVAGFGEFAVDCPRVRFHGLLASTDLRSLYVRCDVGVIPMRGDSWVGVPNKMFDYSEAGLAIVSSLGGESAERIAAHGCGATYAPGDAGSLAEAVRTAAALPKGASRRMFEREFDAARIYDDYVKRILQ